MSKNIEMQVLGANGKYEQIYPVPAKHASSHAIGGSDEITPASIGAAPAPFKPEGKSYLTFSSPNSFTLKVDDNNKHWNGTLEYFASNRTWATWDGTTTLSAVENDGEYVLYLRGTGNTVITGNNTGYKWVLTGSNIACAGDIENLLDYATVEAGNHPTMATYCYQNMFQGCTGLTQAPALPATTMAVSCYSGMFQNCTSLTQAPALPATTLKTQCYSYMFFGCTSLTQAPALPATTLADNCYYQMFYGCTSLTQAPTLPATTLAKYCYYEMFRDCTALTQVTALPATTLANNCYSGMFYGCTSLTQAPTLPATTLSDYCYQYMFRDCTSLTQAPALPATTLAPYCYSSMLSGCISLTQAPALPATTLAGDCYNSMFYGCTSLIQAPALPATTLANSCYYYMFRDCTSLKLSSSKTDEYTQEYRIPSSGNGTTATDALYNMFTSTGGTFTGTPKINTTYYLSSDNMVVYDTEVDTLREYVGSMIGDAQFKPEGKSYLTFSSPNSFTLKVDNNNKHWNGTLEYFSSDKTWTVWDGTTTLSSVDNDGEYVIYIRGTGNTVITGNSSSYTWVLTGSDIECVGNIENLLDYATVKSGAHPTMANDCYSYMFSGCTSLTQAPALPATTLTDYCYFNMFSGCTSLTQSPALPATTLAVGCYQYMFRGCTSLIQAPALPAATLASYCYQNMFFGCTSLIQAPALPVTTLANYCYSQMFQGCTALTQAPALPATTLADNCYFNMFFGCTALTQAPTLPATTLTNQCYYQMFRGCTSLTQAPALPATTLATGCYNSMFYGCTGLKLSSSKTDEYTQEYRIPTTGTGTTASSALSNMFTSTGGAFTETPDINTTYYLSSDNMIVRDTEVVTLREYVGSMIDAANGDAQFKPEGKAYLTFSSPNSFTLAVNDATKHWDGTLEYFSSDKTWTVWDGTTTLTAVNNDGEYVLYLRGTGNTIITGNSNSNDYRWVITSTDVRCIGNIETLLDYAIVEAGNHPTMTDYCYRSMFSSCTALTKAPELPATTLAPYCYRDMFNGCTSLIQAPVLPATTLADNCYRSMFSSCASLTQAPELPATTLAPYCYGYMFSHCTSLIQAPVLPATTLAASCYYYMFNGCTALIQAPVLPATTLAASCYSNMFYACTALTQIPALPATTLADNCYNSMFSDCTSLSQVPALPATTLAAGCYKFMFYNCSNIKVSSTKTGIYMIEYCIPFSGEGTTSKNALTSMFTGTGGTFKNAPSINKPYYLSSDNMVVRETEIATLNGYVSSMIDSVHSYGTEDLEAGTSPLETGKLYFVYE